jgi:uncharacterized protein YndB with AHSA1/START domain
MTPKDITIRMETTAAPEQAWQAWADPAKLAHWFVDRASGRIEPGGVYEWNFDAFHFQQELAVTAASPPERLVLEGAIPGRPPIVTTIEVKKALGKTVITHVQSGFHSDAPGWEDEYEGVQSGWTMAYAVLKYYLEHAYGQTPQKLWFMRPAPITPARVLPRFATAEGLRSWLARSATIGGAGDAVELTLPDGTHLSGRVAAVTRSEVALAIDQIGGVLELKAFAMGGGFRAVAARVHAWHMDPAHKAALTAQLEAGLTRLASEHATAGAPTAG